MTRHPGLVDTHLLDEIVDLPLTLTERVDNAAAGGIGQGVECVYMHMCAYACIEILGQPALRS
jgi:hypothetical protein